MSRTQVFDRPVRGREFFEEIIRDHLDLGRPSRVQLLFTRRITRTTPGRFRTRVVTHGVAPSVHVKYKRCQTKQYFKEERALRTETTFNVLAWLVASSLLLSVGTSAGTSVGTKPEISVSASSAGLIIVQHTPAGSFVSMDALLRAEGAVPVLSDVYVGVLLPDGQSASWVGNPQAPVLVNGPPVPFLANIILSGGTSHRLVIPNFAAGGPEGWYMLYGLVVVAGRDPGDPSQWFSSSFFPLLVTPPVAQ